MAIFTVTAGHSTTDPGNLGGSHHEQRLMAQLRNQVAEHLRQMGHTVRTDGEGMDNWPLTRAMTLVPGSDLAIELHTNAAASATAAGVEVIAKPKRREAATAIARVIQRTLHIPLRRTGGWWDAQAHRIERGWAQPAGFVRAGGLIVETFFQTNPTELEAFFRHRDQLARSIAACMHTIVESES